MNKILIERDGFYHYKICKGIYLQIKKDPEVIDFITDADKTKFLLNFAFSIYTNKSSVIAISKKTQEYDNLLIYRAFDVLTYFRLQWCSEVGCGGHNLIGSFITTESQFVITRCTDEELSRMIASVVDMLRNGYTPMSIRKTEKFKVIENQLKKRFGMEDE